MPRAIVPVASVPMKLPATMLLVRAGCRRCRYHRLPAIPLDDVPLTDVIDAVAIGPDPVAGGASIDHDSAPDEVSE